MRKSTGWPTELVAEGVVVAAMVVLVAVGYGLAALVAWLVR